MASLLPYEGWNEEIARKAKERAAREARGDTRTDQERGADRIMLWIASLAVIATVFAAAVESRVAASPSSSHQIAEASQ